MPGVAEHLARVVAPHHVAWLASFGVLAFLWELERLGLITFVEDPNDVVGRLADKDIQAPSD